MLLTIIVFLIVLSILVLIHEFGHFAVGRFFGVGVEEFALGLPFTKPIFSKKLKDGMKLSLYPLLFGGFVKLLGEEGEADRDRITGKFFYKINVWKRIAIVVAGVGMNLLLAITAFYLFLGFSGFKVVIPKYSDFHFSSPTIPAIAVTAVLQNSPASKAGLIPGDIILSAGGKKFSVLSEFQKYVRNQSGKEVSFQVSDISLANERKIIVVPRSNPPKGEGPIGVGIGEALIVTYATPLERTISGLSYTYDMFGYNINVIGHFASQALKAKNVAPLSESVSGPVGIASAVGSILDLGGFSAIVQLLNLLGLLSLSLAFMNILPVPALDGGRLAFLLVEAFTGKKLATHNENRINQIGMVILLGLIIVVSLSDVFKIVSPYLPH